ncbi:MAG: hypothetical protein IT306_05315 [Chloroflexi bacterium]|nr:hypothetical protein [Chloroflexota bacterium]
MKRISESALKQGIVAVEAERLKHPPTFQPDEQQLAALAESRRRSEAMVSTFLQDAGLDVTKLQAVQEPRSADLARMVEQQKIEAVQRAATHKDTLHASVAAQARALRDLASRDRFFPFPSFSLDTPFLIWSIPLQEISTATTAPFGSFAKFKFATSKRRGPQKFGFYFSWVNSSSDYAVINATTFMSAIGHLKAHAPWAFATNISSVGASAVLNMWLGWPNDVTSVQSDIKGLGTAAAFASFTLGSDTEGASISFGEQLHATMFAVPPGNVVVFEVALLLHFENDSGNIEADFESGEFQIACPVVVVSRLNMPPLEPTP